MEWIELTKTNFISTAGYAKQKYSEIPYMENTTNQAHLALQFLLKNGYVQMNAYYEIEVQKLMKCLRTLKLRVIIKQNDFPKGTIQADNEQGIYEFMLEHFVDDRKNK